MSAVARTIDQIKEQLMHLSIPEPNTGCYLWTSTMCKDGYGKTSYKRKTVRAHRLSFQLFKGDIPPGVLVCHKCDTPAYINPDHLFLGDFYDNARDKIRKGRDFKQKYKDICKNGHLRSGENIRLYQSPISGKKFRVCIPCKKQSYVKKSIAYD